VKARVKPSVAKEESMITRFAVLACVVFALLTSVSAMASSWQIELVDTIGDVGNGCSIALDTMGYPHISYRDAANADLKHAYWDGSLWQIQALDAGPDSVIGVTSIAIDSSDNPRISYCRSDSVYYRLWYGWNDGLSWWRAVVDSCDTLNPANIGWYNSIAIDDSGHAHIAYSSYSTTSLTYCLKYAHGDSTIWTSEIVDTSGSVGLYCSIAIDASGYPHISYYDASKADLKYAHMDGSGWHVQRIDSMATKGLYTSIAIDQFGAPHIGYRSVTEGGLRHAYWDGFGWISELIESGFGMGCYVSLALDPQDYPHISSGLQTGALRYAYFDGGAWNKDVVDGQVQCEDRTSLAIDAVGNAHIAYYDSQQRDLRYATGFPTGVAEHSVRTDQTGTARLYGGSPNPFASGTSIRFYVPAESRVSVRVYDTAGRFLRALVDGETGRGLHSASWDGTDGSGKPVPSGVYLCTLEANGTHDAMRMVVVR
jgi:hypothetical protein